MKNFLPFFFFVLLFVGLTSSLSAQSAFDMKKKKNASVNTSSLGAVHIRGSAITGAGRATIPSRGIMKQNLKFPSQLVPQRPRNVIYSRESGLPSFITSKRDKSSSRSGIKKDIHTATYDYLLELKPILRIEKPDVDFAIEQINEDNTDRARVRLSQQYKGLPVYGSEVIVHLNAFGEGESFNGKYRKINENIEPRPAISEQAAIQKVTSHLENGGVFGSLTTFEKKLVQHEQPKATLCVYQDKGLVKTNVLAYHIVICPTLQERWEYFIDASNGAVLHRFESICSADGPRTATGPDLNGISRTVNTYQKGTTYFMIDISRSMYKAAGSVFPDEVIGGIVTVDMNNTFGDDQTIQHATSANNVWNGATQIKALSAQFNAGAAFEYYETKHGRTSIDGVGGTIISIVNVPDEDGQPMDNAFWNGKVMCYGNGDTAFEPLAGAMDVAGHEMTHGVVQSTANLEYQGESGAINESIADIFGSMMDPADWLIGEDVVKPGAFAGGALRSLLDPHNGTTEGNPGYQPMHMDEAYTGLQDNGGVHINSGIPNHAFYKFAEAITRDKAADVFYKALTDYLTKSSQFIDLRLAVIQAATDLYGAASNEVTQAGLAFDFVGITDGEGGTYTETLPTNPGAEFLLIYDTDETNPNTLYRASSPSGAGVTPLTTTAFRSRPSVTDNGDITVFVAEDNTIHMIRTKPGATPTETVLRDDPMWFNVVISKGGSKLAAITTAQEPVIYVYDFESATWGEFELYNPTYSEGVNSAGPQYPDALEWDYTGQFLVYDCFNRIDNADADGADIEYWDVNFIHVWDSTANDFSDGTIEKLFPSLPDGVSIGNPSFAKNSPYILAFDYVDVSTATPEYAILGCNIETNEVNVIVENNTFGWPSYNKTDSRLAYTSLDEGEDEGDGDDEYQTGFVALNSDKISSATAPEGLYASTKWPVYFAIGEREIGEEVITDVLDEIGSEVAISCYPNPFIDDVSVQIKEPLPGGTSVEVINAMGQKVYEYAVSASTDEPLQLSLKNLKSGYYIMRISNTKKIGSCKIMKR